MSASTTIALVFTGVFVLLIGAIALFRNKDAVASDPTDSDPARIPDTEMARSDDSGKDSSASAGDTGSSSDGGSWGGGD